MTKKTKITQPQAQECEFITFCTRCGKPIEGLTGEYWKQFAKKHPNLKHANCEEQAK